MAHCSRCDVWTQDCADGEACKPWANDGSDEWNATRCSPIDAQPAAVGEPCMAEGSGVSGIDSCEEGAVCWNVGPETLIGRCVEFCGGNHAKPMCGDPDTTCVIANDGVLPLCLPTCDPLAQDCADGEACYPNATLDAFVCLPPGAAHTTGNDLFHTACPAGTFAVDPDEDPQCDAAPCCVPFCDMYEEDTCALGTACESLTPDCGFFLCDQVGACRPTEP